MTFDRVIDSGLFHVFDDEDRARYVTSLATVLRSGGSCYLMCFSDRQPGDWGPSRDPPGRAGNRVRRELERHGHRGGHVRDQPRIPLPGRIAMAGLYPPTVTPSDLRYPDPRRLAPCSV